MVLKVYVKSFFRLISVLKTVFAGASYVNIIGILNEIAVSNLEFIRAFADLNKVVAD